MDLIESKLTKRLYKTQNGVEIKPSLLAIHKATQITSDLTHYYAWYHQDFEDNKWKVSTNKLLFGESKAIVICENKNEAVKIAGAVNAFIRLLTENI
jgi:hypothetical protein